MIFKKKTPPQTSEEWVHQTFAQIVMQMQATQRSERTWTWIWRLLKLLFWISVVALLFKGGEMNPATAKKSEPHTAVIDMTGEIGNYQNTAKILTKGLESAYNNPNVKAIIINANSPGGSPVIADTAFQQIRYLKKQHPNIPIDVVVGDLCASGCYYIAAAADKIYASPASLVGSIGVISNGFGLTGLMDKIGVQRRLHTAGKYKGMGDPFSPETPEENAIWQGMLDDIHTQFIDAVKTGRGKRLLWEKYPDVFSGRVYTGHEAKSVGLIDDYGTIYSVSRDVLKQPNMVNYTPQDNFAQVLSRSFGEEAKKTIGAISSFHW